MKKQPIFRLVLAFLASGIVGAAAAEKVATVTETINEVDRGAGGSVATTPAHVGTSLEDGDYLKTGARSLAELELDNKTIARLGSNTIFNYSIANNEVDLQAGTILFCKPKDGQQLNIKTAAVTAAVVGTTGFFKSSGKNVLFGLIEGHSSITIGGKIIQVGPGEILVLTPGQPPLLFSFNVPRMLATSPLFTSFNTGLPNQQFIDQEIAAYLDDLRRGFIQPGNGPTFTYSNTGLPPNPDIYDWNNALNGIVEEYTTPPTGEPEPEKCGKKDFCDRDRFCRKEHFWDKDRHCFVDRFWDKDHHDYLDHYWDKDRRCFVDHFRDDSRHCFVDRYWDQDRNCFVDHFHDKDHDRDVDRFWDEGRHCYVLHFEDKDHHRDVDRFWDKDRRCFVDHFHDKDHDRDVDRYWDEGRHSLVDHFHDKDHDRDIDRYWDKDHRCFVKHYWDKDRRCFVDDPDTGGGEYNDNKGGNDNSDVSYSEGDNDNIDGDKGDKGDRDHDRFWDKDRNCFIDHFHDKDHDRDIDRYWDKHRKCFVDHYWDKDRHCFVDHHWDKDRRCFVDDVDTETLDVVGEGEGDSGHSHDHGDKGDKDKDHHRYWDKDRDCFVDHFHDKDHDRDVDRYWDKDRRCFVDRYWDKDRHSYVDDVDSDTISDISYDDGGKGDKDHDRHGEKDDVSRFFFIWREISHYDIDRFWDEGHRHLVSYYWDKIRHCFIDSWDPGDKDRHGKGDTYGSESVVYVSNPDDGNHGKYSDDDKGGKDGKDHNRDRYWDKDRHCFIDHFYDKDRDCFVDRFHDKDHDRDVDRFWDKDHRCFVNHYWDKDRRCFVDDWDKHGKDEEGDSAFSSDDKDNGDNGKFSFDDKGKNFDLESKYNKYDKRDIFDKFRREDFSSFNKLRDKGTFDGRFCRPEVRFPKEDKFGKFPKGDKLACGDRPSFSGGPK